MSEDIENIIEEKINQYNEMLKDFDEETKKTALQYLRQRKTELRENKEKGINKNFAISSDNPAEKNELTIERRAKLSILFLLYQKDRNNIFQTKVEILIKNFQYNLFLHVIQFLIFH